MNFAKELMYLSEQLVLYNRDLVEVRETERQRQDAKIEMVTPGLEETDALYYKYRTDQSFIERRIRELRYFIHKLVNSGRLEKRDWEEIDVMTYDEIWEITCQNMKSLKAFYITR